MTDLIQKKCIPCEVGGPAFTSEEARVLMKQIPQWTLADDAKKITRSFTFKDFAGALQFADKIGALAEEEGHHPDLHVSWGKVVVDLSTHAVGGLSENDFILAAKIDAIGV
jgi:4a-hydroxytetrahydrobiopterin dehydratase